MFRVVKHFYVTIVLCDYWKYWKLSNQFVIVILYLNVVHISRSGIDGKSRINNNQYYFAFDLQIK